jgi:hypothetical protein
MKDIKEPLHTINTARVAKSRMSKSVLGMGFDGQSAAGAIINYRLRDFSHLARGSEAPLLPLVIET